MMTAATEGFTIDNNILFFDDYLYSATVRLGKRSLAKVRHAQQKD